MEVDVDAAEKLMVCRFADYNVFRFTSPCINDKLDLWIGICVISEINDIAPRSDFLHALDNDVKVI